MKFGPNVIAWVKATMKYKNWAIYEHSKIFVAEKDLRPSDKVAGVVPMALSINQKDLLCVIKTVF